MRQHEPASPILAEFIKATIASHSLTRAPIAIGYSNGAIMAATLLLTCPRPLAGAILFRPLPPFSRDRTCRTAQPNGNMEGRHWHPHIAKSDRPARTPGPGEDLGHPSTRSPGVLPMGA